MSTHCCRDAVVGLVIVPGALLTLPFNIIARVTLASLPLQPRGSLTQPPSHPDLPLQLQNAVASCIGCETRILWKANEDPSAAALKALSPVSVSPRSVPVSPFAAALASPKPSLQLSNPKLSPFAAALARAPTSISTSPSSFVIGTPSARTAPLSLTPSVVTPRCPSVAQQVAQALHSMNSLNLSDLCVAGLEREARTLLQHIFLQQLQRELDNTSGCRSVVRPLIIIHGCEGCGKRSLVRSAYAAVTPPVVVSELDLSSLPASADDVQRLLELYFANAAHNNVAVLVTGVEHLLTTRKFSSATASRTVSVLIQLLMERQLNTTMLLQSPCIITCSSPEFLDSTLRALAQIELAVPSPSLQDRVTITALHLHRSLVPALATTVAPEFSVGGKWSDALSLACETMSGFRFVVSAFFERCFAHSYHFSGADCARVAQLTARHLNAYSSSAAIQFDTKLVHDALFSAVAAARTAAAPSRIGVKVLNHAPSSARYTALGGLDHVTDALEQGWFQPVTQLPLSSTKQLFIIFRLQLSSGRRSVLRTCVSCAFVLRAVSCFMGRLVAVKQALFVRWQFATEPRC